jgi:predicted metal-dependent hydrolase
MDVLQVEVVRSPRRRKTVEAREVGGVLRLSIPATMTEAEEQRWVDEMRRRFERRRSASRVDLPARARALAARYGLPEPDSIRWVDNQQSRWGSCTTGSRSIRLSSRLAPFPVWVIDYVIVHELAHLAEPNHGDRFHALVARYPKAERATGFLMAKGMFPEEE